MDSRFIIVFLSICFQYGATVEVELANLFKMQQGIGWPHELHVTEGHEALMKLSRTVDNVESCEVTTPDGVTFDVRNPPNNRYERWSDSCGVRVQNIVKSDEGRWRLTVTGQQNLTGWTEVYVEGVTNSYSASPISILDGETHRELELTTLDNLYCLVAQPFSESSLVSGHCRVTLDRANRAVQGNWNVLVGIPGKVEELHVERQVNVNAERLDVGYVHDSSTNKLHIYCNIIHTVKNITFCRFQRTTASSGYNIIDGLSDGRHSYYGDGFAARHCGMTIEHPTEQDYATWRCSVGVQQWEGTHIVQQPPLQALVTISQHAASRRLRNSEEQQEILVQEDMSFTITCHADMSLRYCWFQHPNGSQFTPVALSDSSNTEQAFWYTGGSLQTGDCGITFTHVKEQDAGLWTCHMGPSFQSGVEETESVTVRVTGPLAAERKEVEAPVGGSATLYCRTSNGNRPLDYCRFLSPNFLGISIDQTVTNMTAILGRYYFTPERNLDHGDCSLTINPVYSEDIGEWTCAALVDELTLESRDTILLIQNTRALSQAGIIGMVIGLLVLIAILAVVVLYRSGYIKRPQNWRNTQSSDMVEMRHRMPSNFSTGTNSSTDSNQDNYQIPGRIQPNASSSAGNNEQNNESRAASVLDVNEHFQI